MSNAPEFGRRNDSHFQAIFQGTDQTRSFTASSAQSSAVGPKTNIVRLYATKLCHVKFGDNPTASTSNMPLAAGIPEYFGIAPGQKIAVIRNTEDGTLYITEGSEI
jgi:hypothetical protein